MAPHRSPAHPLAAIALITASVLVVSVSACSSDRAAEPKAKATKPTPTTKPVLVTVPVVPPGTKDCGTLDELAGWPTTTTTPMAGYACILDALTAGAPAQMSVITVGGGQSGRKTSAGYDIPTRQAITWRVVGPHQLTETRDKTEDGGRSTTRTCTGLATGGPRPQGSGCS